MGKCLFLYLSQDLVSKATGLKQLCGGSARSAHWTSKGRAQFGSRVPVDNELLSEMTASYLGGEANGVTCSETGTTRMSATNEALNGG